MKGTKIPTVDEWIASGRRLNTGDPVLYLFMGRERGAYVHTVSPDGREALIQYVSGRRESDRGDHREKWAKTALLIRAHGGPDNTCARCGNTATRIEHPQTPREAWGGARIEYVCAIHARPAAPLVPAYRPGTP